MTSFSIALIAVSLVAGAPPLVAGPGGWRDALKRPGPLPAGGPAGAPPPPAMQADWDVQHYDISLTLDPARRRIDGDIAIRVQARVDAPGPFLLHAGEAVLAALEVESTAVTWTQHGDEVSVPMPPGLVAGDEVALRVRYQAPGTTDVTALGLHWGDPIYTFSEPSGARDWLVVYDTPTDKATLTWQVTAPSDLVVIANGEPAGQTEGEDGTTTWDFDFPWPIATYLMVVDAGSYLEDVDETGPVPVHTWAQAGDYDEAVTALADTPEMIEVFAGLFGPYPYSLYGNVLVPFGGAMEHTTKTSFGDELIGYGRYATLVDAHELAHQWWGDWVTCAEWEEIWLNEGFASYSEALWVEATEGEDALRDYLWIEQRDSYLNWLDWEGEFALYDPDYMWGGTVYDKGSFVLHMLRFVVGDEAFFDGLARYRDAHGGDVATTEDLRAAMEAAFGDSLEWFFDEWVYRAGDPSYRVGITNQQLDDGTWQVDVHVQQTGAETWAMPVEWTLHLRDGQELADEHWIDAPRAVVSTCLGQPATGIDFSPHAHLLYRDLQVDLDGFDPAPVVCGPPPDDTAPPGDSAADTGDGGEPGVRSCGCGAPGVPAVLLIALLGGLPWLTRRRP
ncbi:MAG: M1 family metallopeptidase [Pseudomonadota bacterium]